MPDDKKAAFLSMMGPPSAGDLGPPAPEDDGADEAMEAASHDAMQAMHAKDAKGFLSAMKDLFAMMESQPHDEAAEEPPPEA